MLLSKLVKKIIHYYPIKFQEKWDQSGLIIKSSNFEKQDLNKVLICLDINEEIVNEAIIQKCNLIITHHPIFLDNHEFSLSKIEKKLVKKIILNKINVLAMHTNFDNHFEGINSFIAKKLYVTNINKMQDACIFIGNLKKSLNVKQFSNIVFNKFQLLKVSYDNQFANNSIHKIALCCGSGFSEFKKHIDYLKNHVDCLLTGDVKWHDWQLSNIYKIPTIDIGHDIEKIFIEIIKQKLLTIIDSNQICIPSAKSLTCLKTII